MINRITAVAPPANGRRAPSPGFVVPEPSDHASPWADLGERVEKYIGDHPVTSLAIGFAVGIFVGCLLKRR